MTTTMSSRSSFAKPYSSSVSSSSSSSQSHHHHVRKPASYTRIIDKQCEENKTFLKAVETKNFDTIKLLLGKKAVNINCVNKEGYTPLHIASKQGCLETIRILLRYNPDLMRTNEKGATALFIAVINNKRDVADLILRHGTQSLQQEDSKYRQKYFQFCESIINDDITTFEALLKLVSDVDFLMLKGETPLHFAVIKNRQSILESLLLRDANPNQNKGIAYR